MWSPSQCPFCGKEELESTCIGGFSIIDTFNTFRCQNTKCGAVFKLQAKEKGMGEYEVTPVRIEKPGKR